MVFLTSFFALVADAYAEAGDVVKPEDSSSGFTFISLIPMLAVFVIFYFLVIKPQQSKIKNHNKMIESIKKGDKVIFSGGLIGHVAKIDNEKSVLSVKIAEGTEVQITKGSVSEIAS